ncbi:MAG TPA: DUF5801 repeats-in-toxin domain-containing protein, partial [Xanthobacteraceae bacterium]|nr:DUF5801 repeats-in-toxin domain-containing protein [Xanthobacteraceae bacterium]
MNGPNVVAQANIGGSAAATRPLRTIKLSKPQGDQAVVVQLGYEQNYKLDFSGIANEKITLVHIGEKLIILFDNKSTVTVEPFFDSMNTPLANIVVEAGGHDFTGAEFASAFPITTDQSILTAAGVSAAAGTPSSGGDFHGSSVDPLELPQPLPLLGQEELPNWVTSPVFGPAGFTQTIESPPLTIAGHAGGVVEEEDLNQQNIVQPTDAGNGNEDQNSASGNDHDTASDHSITGHVINISLAGLVSGGTSPFTFALNNAADGTQVVDSDGHPVTSFGAPVTFTFANATLIEGVANGRLIFTLEIIDATTGTFRFTLNDQIDHPTHSVDIGSTSNGSLEETLTLDLSSIISGHDSGGHQIALDAGMFTVDVIDDTPVAHIADAVEATVTVDETVPSGDEGADPFSIGTPLGVATTTLVSIAGSNAGADGLGSSTHLSLEVAGGDGADSGLTTTDGTAIHLFLVSGIVEGRVDGSGDVAFALSINDAGQVTLAQYQALHQNDPNNPNDAVDLSGKINAVVTVTDGDGDIATNSVDIGGEIRFLDDAPAGAADTDWAQNGINAVGNVLADLTHNGAPSGTFADVADTLGADGFGSISWAGEVGGVVAGTHGTLTVGVNGDYTYAVNSGDAAVAALPNGTSLTDTFNYTITDGDGDASSATLTVSVFGSDHGVTITNLTPEAQGGDAAVNEANLANGSAPNAPALTQTGTFNISAPDGLD